MENLKDIFNSYKEEIVDAKGLTIDIDGIDCYGLYGKIKKIWLQDKFIYKGIGKAIFVDKNHDLSYYFAGSDYVNEAESYSIINTANKYGYEWGGCWEETKVQSTYIGAGLSNTNSLIYRNLDPLARGWNTIWKKIEIFREIHSDNWFIPSAEELNLIYEATDNVDNLSTLTDPYYWSSSADSGFHAWGQNFNTGCQDIYSKCYHFIRSRLCVRY